MIDGSVEVDDAKTGLESVGMLPVEAGEKPEPYDATNPAQRLRVSKLIDEFLRIHDSLRLQFEWAAFRNLCMIAGAHDVIRTKGRVRLRNIPDTFPRTYTNKIREKRNDLVSAVAQGRVPIKHLPATDDDAAHATAEIGERVRDVIYTETALDEKEAEIAGWFIDTGNVFLHPYYDYDEKYGTAPSAKQNCPQCGGMYGATEQAEHDIDEAAPMCPECGPDLENGQNGNPPSALQPAISPEELAALKPEDAAKDDRVDMLPIGALCVDVLSSFEVRGDYRIRDSRNWTWWVRIQRYDVSDAKEKFNYDGGADETTDGTNHSLFYLDVIAALSDQFNPQGGLGNVAASSRKMPKVTAYTLFMLPNEDFPEGLCAKRIGKLPQYVIDIDPLDTEYGVGVKKGKKFLPLVHGKAVAQSGRLLGSSPLDDAVPLQKERNNVRRAIEMEIRRMAGSGWLNPKGSGLESTSFTGDAGLVLGYNPVTLGGTTPLKPERIVPQLQFLQYLLEQVKQIDDEIERVTGTYFLAGGDSPPGVSAASALSLLDQRSKKAIGPMMRGWAKMFLELDKQTLEIARKHWTDKRIHVAAGQNKDYEVASFMNSDLQGAVTMDIDYESLFPQSEATERAEITQLIQGQIINPQDPEQKLEVLRRFGKMGMLPSESKHTRRARIEQSTFLKTSQPPTLLPMVHNSMIHIREHVEFANTDEFMALAPELQQLWIAHIQTHFVDEGARRGLLAEMQLNPDAPGAGDITEGGAVAAAQGVGSVMGGAQPGSTVGNQVGSGGPQRKPGFTGGGPNQAKAADARSQQVLTQAPAQPADLAGAVEPGQ